MGKTRIHIILGKFNNGIDCDIPIEIKKHWDRHNNSKGYFRYKRNKLKDKIINETHRIRITKTSL